MRLIHTPCMGLITYTYIHWQLFMCKLSLLENIKFAVSYELLICALKRCSTNFPEAK